MHETVALLRFHAKQVKDAGCKQLLIDAASEIERMQNNQPQIYLRGFRRGYWNAGGVSPETKEIEGEIRWWEEHGEAAFAPER